MKDWKTIVGVVPTTTPVPSNVVREQAKLAAYGTDNDKTKRYFGYSRFITDEGEDDGVLTKNSDDKAALDKWVSEASADDKTIWAGYFDNISGKLVRETTPQLSVTVTPDKPAARKSGKSGLGWILGGLAAMVGVVIATKKKG